MSDKQKKGEPFPGTVEERPDDAHPGTADTQDEGGGTPPVEPPPTDPGNLPEPPRKPGG